MKATPILYSALGAITSYYGIYASIKLQSQILWVLIFLLILSSITRVLSSLKWLFSEQKTHRIFRRYNVYIIAFVLGFGIGLKNGATHIAQFGIVDEKIIGFYGILEDDPRSLASGNGMGNLTIQRVSSVGGVRTSAKGNIPVLFPLETIPRLKEFGRGCEIYVEGYFFQLKNSEKNIFRAKEVHIVKPAKPMEQFRTALRLNLVNRYEGKKWGGLVLALLLGVRDNLDSDFAKNYQYSGCSHVLALSGLHLAIIAFVIAFLLKKPLGLKAGTIIGLVCILTYTYLVGNLPSLTRSVIMYAIACFAVLMSLQKQVPSILAMSFLIQTSLYPNSGRSISFILSYLALIGILFIGENIHLIIKGYIPEILAHPLSASLGAFIATACVVVLFFDVLRPIGIIAGLFIVPLTMLFMVIAIVDLVFPFLSIFSGMLLSVLYDVLERLAFFGALVPSIRVGSFLILVFSLVLMLLCFLLRYKRKILSERIEGFG